MCQNFLIFAQLRGYNRSGGPYLIMSGKTEEEKPIEGKTTSNETTEGKTTTTEPMPTPSSIETKPKIVPAVPKRDDSKLQHNRVPGGVDDSSSDDEDSSEQFKVILLGDGAVGKTSVAMRFCNDFFSKKYKQTIGLDFFMKRITLPGKPGTGKGAETHVALQIWDIGGQTIGGEMIGNYIHGAKAVLLLYDITDMTSFQNLEEWYRLVRRTFKGQPLPYLGLVGNKTDLSHMRAVGRDKHQMFADENSMKSYFLSAKTGDMVNSSIYRIAADLAGVALISPKEVSSVPVTAHIIDHQRHDPEEQREASIEKPSNCSTM